MEKIIWWKEGKSIEKQVSIDQCAENFRKSLESLETSKIQNGGRKICQKLLFKAFCDELNCRFPKKGQFLDEETIESLTETFRNGGFAHFSYDIPEDRNCYRSNILLDEKYTFIKNYLGKYLCMMAKMISLSQNGQKDLMSEEKRQTIEEFDEGNIYFEQLLEKNTFGIIVDLPGFFKTVTTRFFANQEISEIEILALMNKIASPEDENEFLRLAKATLESILQVGDYKSDI